MEVILYQVPLMCLREKIAAYKMLFDKDPLLEVTGTFRRRSDEVIREASTDIISFSSGPNPQWHQADPDDTKSIYLTVEVDGEFVKLTPMGNVIGAIRLS